MKPEIQSETTRTSAFPSSSSKFKNWKWEKRHWLALIGLVCLALWWLAPRLNTIPWLQNAISYLPVIGSLAFATDSLLKLTK